MGRPKGKRTNRIKVKLANPRERKFVRSLLRTGEIGKASLMAGYSDSTYGSKILKRERVQRAIVAALENQEVHDEYIAKKIKEGCEATYPIKKSSKGAIIQGNDPDYFTRAIYIDKILKIRGDYAPEQHEITEKRIVVVMTPELAGGLVDAEAITEAEVEEIKTLPKHEEENKDGTESKSRTSKS